MHALSYRVWQQCIDWQIHELAKMSYVVDTQKLESVIRKLCLRRTNYRYTILLLNAVYKLISPLSMSYFEHFYHYT